MIFDLLAVQLNGPKADGRHITINWRFADTREIYRLILENAALTYTQSRLADGADASVTLVRDALDAVVLGRTTISEAVRSGQIKVVGESDKVIELFSLLDSFSSNFEIVEPKRAMH
jgi:alkyl sulfatase BDS1-like metallo-beta-lactamase superfamily hydrolase